MKLDAEWKHKVAEMNAVFETLVAKGIAYRDGVRWAERSGEFQPVYHLTELGKAMAAAGLKPSQMLE
jgi:hypothetical protein